MISLRASSEEMVSNANGDPDSDVFRATHRPTVVKSPGVLAAAPRDGLALTSAGLGLIDRGARSTFVSLDKAKIADRFVK